MTPISLAPIAFNFTYPGHFKHRRAVSKMTPFQLKPRPKLKPRHLSSQLIVSRLLIAGLLFFATPITILWSNNLSATVSPSSSSECRYLSQFELQSLADNVGESLSQIHLSARYRGPHLEGYFIKHVSSNSIFTHYGLKRGDTIIRLNNIDLADQRSWATEVRQLPHRAELNLDIMRQGRMIRLHYILDGNLQCG